MSGTRGIVFLDILLAVRKAPSPRRFSGPSLSKFKLGRIAGMGYCEFIDEYLVDAMSSEYNLHAHMKHNDNDDQLV